MMVLSTSEQPDASFAFCKWLAEEECQDLFGAIKSFCPGLKKAVADPFGWAKSTQGEDMNEINMMYDYTVPESIFYGKYEWYDAVNAELGKIWSGDLEAEQGLAAAQEAGQAVVDQYADKTQDALAARAYKF